MLNKIREVSGWLAREGKKGSSIPASLVKTGRLPWRYRCLAYYATNHSLRPLKKGKIISWKQNYHKIEIEIFTGCNLKCYNCNRSVRQAPSGEMMTVEQINKFVDESIANKWEWWVISLIGGEPTLHPKILEIIEAMKPYMEKFPHCRLEIATNGHGKKVNEIIETIPSWVHVRNSSKESNSQPHTSYNVAPMDVKRYKNANFKKACVVIEDCGIGLTRYGYYHCGPAGSIDRVFGYNMGIKQLSKVNNKSLAKQKKMFCKICGHYKKVEVLKEGEEKMSKTWIKAYSDYKEKKPELNLY